MLGWKWLDVIGHYTHPVWKCDDFRAWLHFWSKISLIYVREYFQLWILCSGLLSVMKIQVFIPPCLCFMKNFMLETSASFSVEALSPNTVLADTLFSPTREKSSSKYVCKVTYPSAKLCLHLTTLPTPNSRVAGTFPLVTTWAWRALFSI